MQRFVIVAHGRSGSSLLQTGLNLHPSIHCFGELFHNDPRHREPALSATYAEGAPADDFCREVIFGQPPRAAAAAVGFKLFFYHARKDEAAARLWSHLAADASLRVILLERLNLFDSLVSHERSQRARQWRLSPGQALAPAYREALRIDPVQCRGFFQQTLAGIAMMRRLFAQHARLDLTYEDLSEDFIGVLRRCHAFLGQPPRDYEPPLRRMNQLAHADGVANYAELEATFRLTPYSSFFPGTEAHSPNTAAPSPAAVPTG
jgi:LPS sulfotransferase NodH